MPVRMIVRILPSILCRVPESRRAEDLTAVERPMNRSLSNAASALLCIRRNQPCLLGCSDDFLRSFNRYADRLFAEDIYSAVEKLDRHHVMQTVWPADIRSIHLEAAVQELVNCFEGLNFFPASCGVDGVCEGLGLVQGCVDGGDDSKACFAGLN